MDLLLLMKKLIINLTEEEGIVLADSKVDSFVRSSLDTLDSMKDSSDKFIINISNNLTFDTFRALVKREYFHLRNNIIWQINSQDIGMDTNLKPNYSNVKDQSIRKIYTNIFAQLIT